MFYSIQHKNIDIEAWLLLSFFMCIPLSDLFCELHNEKTLFSIMDERNSVFLIFIIKLFFYSTDLFDCAANFKFNVNIFIILKVNTNQT